MQPAGVKQANLIQMRYYGFDNTYVLKAIELHPDRFVGTAMIDPFGPDPARQMRSLAQRRCLAFRIQPEISQQPPATWLRPKEMDALFRTAVENHLVLSALVYPDGLPELSRMCAAYPEAPVIIDHCSRIGASKRFSLNRLNVETLSHMAQHPQVYLKLGTFYALGRRQPPCLDLLPMD